MLYLAAVVIDDDTVTDRIEHRLKFIPFAAQAKIGGLKLVNLLLDLGIKADF